MLFAVLLVGWTAVSRERTVQAATFATVAPGVISLKGKIELGDCERWTAALGPDITTVLLNSSGGRDGQGECISRSIAARHMRTVVLERCASICFLLFAAGTEKVVCQGGRVGIHRPRDVETSEEPADPKFLDTILDYARRYHVPQDLMTKLAETPSRTIYTLTPEDLASMDVRSCP